MAITITQDVKRSVVITFWVTEDTNSPYQGRLEYTTAEFALLSAADIKAAATAQYIAWRTIRDTPVPPPTREQKRQMLADWIAQRAQLNSDIDVLSVDPDVGA